MFMFTTLFLCQGQVSAVQAEEKRAVILIVDELTHQVIANTNLMETGSYGLLNTATGGRRTRNNAFLTIGLGRGATGGNNSGLAFNSWEKYTTSSAHELYQKWIDHSPPGVNIFHLGINQIKAENNFLEKTLGDILTTNGIEAYVYGNADFNTIDRSIANVVISSNGTTKGNISADLYTEINGIRRTNLEKLWNQVEYPINSLTVVQISDLLYLNDKKAFLSKHKFNEFRNEFIVDLERYVEFLKNNILDSSNDLLIVTAAVPETGEASRRNFMTPILIWGSDFTEGGIITSPTTKREGIVTLSDIAPTILSHFSLENEMVGRIITAISTVEPEKTFGQVTALNEQLIFIYNTRPPVIKTYVFGQIIVVLLFLVTLIRGFKGKWIKYMYGLLMGLLSMPLVFLLAAPFSVNPILFWVMLFLLIALLVLSAFYLEVRKKLAGILMLTTITVIALMGDLLSGNYLIKQSLLGYDAIAGARYYGVGNEYMGVLIGSTIISSGLLVYFFPNLNKYFIVGALVFISAIIGHPSYGTNVGGAVTSVFGFGLFSFLLLGVQLTATKFAAIGGIGLLALVVLFNYDLARSVETQSHIGRTATMIKNEGISELFHIAMRKWSMNIKLIKYTNWTRVFLVFVISLIFLSYNNKSYLSRIMNKYPEIKISVSCIFAASLATLLLNDSGIVAAATMMIYGGIPAFYLCLREFSS